MENKHINCDNCGHTIDIEKVLYAQIQKEIISEYNEKNVLEKKELEKKLRQEISDSTSLEIETYKEELAKKSNELKDLNKLKAQIEIAKREMQNLRETIEVESEQKLTQRIILERDKLKKELENKSQLLISEKNILIEQLSDKLKDAQRKIEQGSVQSQGEAQEVLIEEYLRISFPTDNVCEIKKGARGHDCTLKINTSTKANAGSIYVESKRTKEFQSSWLEKFKGDMRAQDAVFGVLVTDVMPKDMERMGQREGIWVCTFEEFKSLCFVLRESVILLSNVEISQEHKGEKMAMVYDYITSTQFKNLVLEIVETLTSMNDDLSKEKRAIESIWKKREQQIYKTTLNISDFYSSMKAIAGTVIANIPLFELPKPDSADKKSK